MARRKAWGMRTPPDASDAAHAIFCGQNGVLADRADRGGAAVRVGGEKHTHGAAFDR